MDQTARLISAAWALSAVISMRRPTGTHKEAHSLSRNTRTQQRAHFTELSLATVKHHDPTGQSLVKILYTLVLIDGGIRGSGSSREDKVMQAKGKGRHSTPTTPVPNQSGGLGSS